MTGAISERNSPTNFVLEMLGGADDELAASVPAVRRPAIISYNTL